MKPELSIIMPGIRPEHWVRAYESILTSTKRSFELIIVSPFSLPKALENIGNIKFVKDFGSPTRASQIGNTLAEGFFIFPNFCDDAVFIEGAIDANLNLLESMGQQTNNVVTCKYSESSNFSAPERYQDDDYYRMINSYPVNKATTPKDWWITNNPFWYRTYFENLGGYDCSFGVCPIAHADLGMRAYLHGASIKLSAIPILKVDHGQSDHQPIEISQTYHDSPAFARKYNSDLSKISITLPMDNWKNSDAIWKFRFKTNE